jgi:hypothetical protein
MKIQAVNNNVRLTTNNSSNIGFYIDTDSGNDLFVGSSTNFTGSLNMGTTNATNVILDGPSIQIGNSSITNPESLLFVYGSSNQTASSAGPTNAVNAFNDIVGFKSDIVTENRLVLGTSNSTGSTSFVGLAYSSSITGS